MRQVSDKTRLRRLQKVHKRVCKELSDLQYRLMCGTRIDTLNVTHSEASIVRVATALNHYVLVRQDGNQLVVVAVRK